MIGLGFGLTNLRRKGLPPVITATAAPGLGPLTEAQVPSDSYLPGSYASTAGAITGAVATYHVNGIPADGSADLAAGDSVFVAVLVSDSAGNSRTFTSASITVSAVGGVPALLLIVAGQSNSRTAGNSSSTPNSKYTTGTPFGDMSVFLRGTGANTLAEIAAGSFAAYDITANADPDNSGTAWGSEAEFVWRMRQAGDLRPVYMVKESQNGQNISSDWAPGTSNDNFAYLEAKVARARTLIAAAGESVTEEIILWNQGEADANYDATSDAYQANFSAFLAAIRSRVSATAYIIAERIRPLGYAPGDGIGDGGGWIRAWKVREATLAGILADGNGTVIDLDFIPSNFAQIHPPEPWTEGKGLRCYAAYMGTYAGTYGAITDTTPAAFTIPDVTGAAVSTTITSAAVLIGGIERRSPITVSGCEYRTLNSLNSDSVVQDWGSAPGYVDKYQKVQLRRTSSASNSTALDATVTIGGVSDTWTVTTEAAGVTYEAETDAFIATLAANGGGALNGTQKTKLNDLYIALKAAGLIGGAIGSRKLKRLFLNVGSDAVANRIDLADQTYLATFTATGGGDIPWTSAGFNCGAVAQRGLAFGVTAANWSQNNVGLFAWLTPNATAQSDVTSSDDTMQFRQTTALQRGKINTATNQNRSGTYSAAGLYLCHRQGATTTNFYGPDGNTLGAASAAASSAPSATELYLGNPTGSTSDRAIQGFGVIGDVDATDRAAFYAAINGFFA